VGFGLPVPVFVARPGGLLPAADGRLLRAARLFPTPPWSSNNTVVVQPQWCMDSPTIGATPTTGAMGGPENTTIMTTATMTSMDHTARQRLHGWRRWLMTEPQEQTVVPRDVGHGHASMTCPDYATPIIYAPSHHAAIAYTIFLSLVRSYCGKQQTYPNKNARILDPGMMPFSIMGENRFNPPLQLYFHHLHSRVQSSICISFFILRHIRPVSGRPEDRHSSA